MDSYWNPTGFLLDSYCIPIGFLLDSFQIPIGFLLDSSWIPAGFLPDSCWILVGFQLDSCWIPVGFLLDSNGFLSESGYLSDLIEKLYLCCYMYIYALLILDLNAVWLPGRPGPLTSIGLGQATFLASPCHTYLQGGGQQQPNYTTTNNQPTTNNRPTTNNQGRQQQQQNNMQQTHPCPMHRAQGRIIPFGGTPHSHPSSILQGGTYYSSGMNRLCSHGMQYIATRFDIKHTLHKPKRYNI